MITPRQAFLTLEYDGTDISSDIRKDVENFTYTDSGSDSSDSLSIKVNAMDHKWINSWMPDKEAVLHPTLCTTNWIVQGDRTVLDCGTLVVDDLSFSACPDVLTIGAVARPNGTSFHEKKQRAGLEEHEHQTNCRNHCWAVRLGMQDGCRGCQRRPERTGR